MERCELSKFCDDVENYMKANGLIFHQDTALSAVPDERYQQYKEAVADILLDRTYSEVRALDKVVAYYQMRYNVVGSLHKAFGEDGLLENYIYINFSEQVSEYWKFLNTDGVLERCLNAITNDVFRRSK